MRNYKPISQLPPEQAAKARAREQRRNKRRRLANYTPEQAEKERAKWLLANIKRLVANLSPEQYAKLQVRLARRKKPTSKPFAGSVLAACADGLARDMLLELTNLAPRYDPATRADIISEAAMLMCEGMNAEQAIAKATKTVNRFNSELRYCKPLEDCFWL